MAYMLHTHSHSLAFTKQPLQRVRFLHGHVKPFGRCSKLPVLSASYSDKPIPTFKSVSKHEDTKLIMVSDSETLYSLDITQLLKSDDIPATRKQVSLPIGWKWKYIRGQRSCNGLVLAEDVNRTIFLLNPTTQELFRIPDPPFALIKSVVSYEFGYDSSTNDYKVICISNQGPSAIFDTEAAHVFVSLYSLRNNSWKNLPNAPYFFYGDGFLFHQNLHWVVSRLPDFSITIVAFGLANGEISEIQLPSEDKAGELVVVGGKLGVVETCGDGCDDELWVMEEYGVAESWTRLCSLEFGKDVHGVKASCLVEGSKLFFVLSKDVLSKDGDELVLYDVDERRCINVRILGGPTRIRYPQIGATYVETLESPKRFITSP